MKNGYFRLVSDVTGFGVKIVKPSDGGEPVRVLELTEYLQGREIHYDLTALRAAVNKGETLVFHLGEAECPGERGICQLSVNADNMSATIRLIAPSEKGAAVTQREIMEILAAYKICFGIKEDVIKKSLEEEAYCTDIVIAEGILPRQGTDARIEYYFNTDINTRPTQKDDGSVDFFNLNTISHCRQGDVIARLLPEDPGEYGVDIKGTKLKPRDVKKENLKYSNNIQISQDKTVLTSMVDGHVTLVEGKVFVANLLVIENVDNSTGNIQYEGSVQVNGNVQSNFHVQARGNIVVNGAVEGAFLEAGGDIIIARGMNGMGKGTLKASRNIVAKFLENATVSAAGYVTTDSILHCIVMAGEEVDVEGRRGFITGGRVCASKQIKVKNLGSGMGASTIVEVGVDPTVKAQFVQLQKDVAELSKEIRSVEPVIATYVAKKKQGAVITNQQMMYLKTIMTAWEANKTQLDSKTALLNELQQQLEQQAQAQVIVLGEVYPGTKIAIGDLSMVVASNMKYCKFIKLQGEVKMVGI